jgi:hypothetical protein
MGRYGTGSDLTQIHSIVISQCCSGLGGYVQLLDVSLMVKMFYKNNSSTVTH